MKGFLLIIISILFLEFSSDIPKTDYKKKALQTADSVLQKFIGKSNARKFYQFDKSVSIIEIGNTESIEWKDELKRKPKGYWLCYLFKPDPTSNRTYFEINLDSNFKPIEINNIIDSSFLINRVMSQKELLKIELNSHFKNVVYEHIIYKKLQGKITCEPFIEIRNYLKSFNDSDGVCLTNRDTCLLISPLNGKVISGYIKDDRKECLCVRDCNENPFCVIAKDCSVKPDLCNQRERPYFDKLSMTKE